MTTPALLELQDVHRSFDHGLIPALAGVNLTLGTAESIAIVGRSGSGKSCLVNIATGLDEAGSGRVLWQGREITARQDWATIRRTNIGIVFQEVHLVPTLTAQQNVELALMGGGLDQTTQRARAGAALESVGMAHRSTHLPSQLSGGERQRVAIARAIACEPILLFADEPTGNLDSASAAMVAELLFSLQAARNMGLVLVTHDEALAARCGRIVRMKDGQIIDDLPARHGGGK